MEEENKSKIVPLPPIMEPPDPAIFTARYTCPECGEVIYSLIQYYKHMSHYHNMSKPLRNGKRAIRAPLASELLEAMAKARAGIHRAARMMGVSKPYFIKWAEKLIPLEFKEYRLKRLQGVGVTKGSVEIVDLPAYKFAQKVLAGTKPAPRRWVLYPHERMRHLIRYGLLPTGCQLCGFNESRLTDYKSPLLVDFIDNNQSNWHIDNLRILCYNCYFLNVHDLWGKSKVTALRG